MLHIRIVDYRCENIKEVCELRGNIGVIWLLAKTILKETEEVVNKV